LTNLNFSVQYFTTFTKLWSHLRDPLTHTAYRQIQTKTNGQVFSKTSPTLDSPFSSICLKNRIFVPFSSSINQWLLLLQKPPTKSPTTTTQFQFPHEITTPKLYWPSFLYLPFGSRYSIKPYDTCYLKSNSNPSISQHKSHNACFIFFFLKV
jgi:hypothetical protein